MCLYNKVKSFNNSFSRSTSYENNVKMIKNMKKCIEDLCLAGRRCDIPNMNRADGDDHFLDSLINFSEFSFVIKSVNKNSALGYDKINYVIIPSDQI